MPSGDGAGKIGDMRIAVTGASGFLGSALVSALHVDGHDVVRLVRRTAQASDEVSWDPAAHDVDETALAGTEAVIHLAGVNVGGRRWSSSYRRKILGSRTEGTTTISQAVARLDPQPAVLLSASAVGYYGDTGDRLVDESQGPGSGFLADVVRQWEASTAPAEAAGVRVVHLRSGIVLAKTGGVLKPILPIFRLGLGGRLGSGRQYVSWISLPDELAAIRFLLTASDIAGPVNLTAPDAVTNAEYTKAIGRAVHRPAVLPVPAGPLRLALDGLADEALLAGQRVRPRVLTEAGFAFAHPDIVTALRAVL
jgi:uncharacterized protein (TIGR01777 family)